MEDGKGIRRNFKAYPIGYLHIDIAEVRTAEGRLYLVVAVDRTSKFDYTELHEKIGSVQIHTVLTDIRNRFHRPKRNRWTAAVIKTKLKLNEPFRAHPFEFQCARSVPSILGPMAKSSE